MPMFKKRRGIKLPDNKQGLIYFTCMNIQDMPEDVQYKIVKLCDEIGKEEYREALYEVLTNSNETIRSLALKYHVSEMSLYRFRKKFYEEWERTSI